MSGQFLQGGSLQWNHNLYLQSTPSTVGEVTLSFTATLLLPHSFINDYGEKKEIIFNKQSECNMQCRSYYSAATFKTDTFWG